MHYLIICIHELHQTATGTEVTSLTSLTVRSIDEVHNMFLVKTLFIDLFTGICIYEKRTQSTYRS